MWWSGLEEMCLKKTLTYQHSINFNFPQSQTSIRAFFTFICVTWEQELKKYITEKNSSLNNFFRLTTKISKQKTILYFRLKPWEKPLE